MPKVPAGCGQSDLSVLPRNTASCARALPRCGGVSLQADLAPLRRGLFCPPRLAFRRRASIRRIDHFKRLGHINPFRSIHSRRREAARSQAERVPPHDPIGRGQASLLSRRSPLLRTYRGRAGWRCREIGIDLAPTGAVARCKLAAVLSKMPWHNVAYFLESFETYRRRASSPPCGAVR